MGIPAEASDIGRRVGRLLSVAGLILLGTCTSNDEVMGPSLGISDAAHLGGNKNFFFLPPMVPDPSRNPHFRLDAFDASLQPTVEICLLEGSACALGQPPQFPLVYTWSTGPGSEKVTLTGDHYQVNWHAGDFDLTPGTTYRLQVSVGRAQLGYADVQVVRNGSGLRNVSTEDYIGLVSDRTLPIKFRIQHGAFASINIQETIAVSDGTPLVTPDINPPQPEPVHIAVTETVDVTDGVEADAPPIIPPVRIEVAEKIQVADGPRAVLPASISVHETVMVSDQPGVLTPVSVEVHEVVTVTDGNRVLPPLAISVSENVNVTDQGRVLPPLTISVSEIIGVTDAADVTLE